MIVSEIFILITLPNIRILAINYNNLSPHQEHAYITGADGVEHTMLPSLKATVCIYLKETSFKAVAANTQLLA